MDTKDTVVTGRSAGTEPSVQSIERAVAILRCFEKGSKLTLTEICAAVGLHKSTTYGIVTTLKNSGLLDKNEETGKYQLGVGLYRLVANVELDLRDVCVPHIRSLCETTGETVNMVVPDGTHVIYIEKRESAHSVRISTSIGKRLPMYCTAVGKAILSCMSPEEASLLLDRTSLVPQTRFTLTGKDDILRQLVEVRERGYALDSEELEYGLVCVAVPIVNAHGVPIAALSCSGPIQRMSEERINVISQELLAHAHAVSAVLLH